MAYIGKEYKFEKEENFEEFIKVLSGKEDKALAYLSYKPNVTLLKNGDEYTWVFTLKEANVKKEVSFKIGVPFDEELPGPVKAKSVVSLDGETFTQVQEFASGSVTIKRDYSGGQLKVSISSSVCDNTATRYYVPA